MNATAEIKPAPRGRNPFASTGVERGADGIARYAGRPESLVAMLRTSVERRGDAVAVVELGGEQITYRELWDRAARVAGGIRDAGVARGDRVGLRRPNGLDWVLAFWGIQLAGAIAVPINTRLSGPEVAFLIEDSGAVLTIDPDTTLPSGTPQAVEPSADDPAAIFYTSGTTGSPKGAVCTHANFLANSESAFRILQVDRSEGPELSTLISVPLFHVTGCNSQMIPLLELGGRVEILERALDVERFLGAIHEHRIAHLVSVPAIYHALVRHERFAEFDVGSVRWLLYGGAPITAAQVRDLQAHFPNARLGNGFGLTESSSLVSLLPHEESAEHPDSVGFAMPVVDLAIDRPHPQEGTGELLVRGPNVISGYWNKPEATAATFERGWLRTGDIARIDEDGLLYIVDRLKDMINRGGENVYCLEVENALAGAPGVDEVAAVGVPDSMMGEKVGAVIVPAGGQEIDAEAILAHARARLADFKVPQYLATRESPLPRNAAGKVLKQQLREETDWGEPLR